MGRRSSGIERGWQREFEDPVELPDGRTTTLRDAADYITALPKQEAALPEWQAAIDVVHHRDSKAAYRAASIAAVVSRRFMIMLAFR